LVAHENSLNAKLVKANSRKTGAGLLWKGKKGQQQWLLCIAMEEGEKTAELVPNV